MLTNITELYMKRMGMYSNKIYFVNLQLTSEPYCMLLVNFKQLLSFLIKLWLAYGQVTQ